jgi:7,8-dihydropterin-6-yl-methyl-4-(beta-D-ribofuranosyl)aminobenzene 5'-phosphate synthase
MRFAAQNLLLASLLAMLLAFMGCGQSGGGDAGVRKEDAMTGAERANGEVILTVVYDNNPFLEGLKTAWGFSCLVEGKEKTVLFDTGGDGETLLYNMSRLEIDPVRIEAVVISHAHGDHTGGLSRLLEVVPDLEVYLPASAAGLKDPIIARGASPVIVQGARQICDGIWSSGEVAGAIGEQALLVEGGAGFILISGCAHPGIVNMVRQAETNGPGEVLAVMGGFHLGASSGREINAIIAELKELDVRYAGPCHCSGDKARQAFSEAFGHNFIQVGVGSRISSLELE